MKRRDTEHRLSSAAGYTTWYEARLPVAAHSAVPHALRRSLIKRKFVVEAEIKQRIYPTSAPVNDPSKPARVAFSEGQFVMAYRWRFEGPLLHAVSGIAEDFADVRAVGGRTHAAAVIGWSAHYLAAFIHYTKAVTESFPAYWVAESNGFTHVKNLATNDAGFPDRPKIDRAVKALSEWL